MTIHIITSYSFHPIDELDRIKEFEKKMKETPNIVWVKKIGTQSVTYTAEDIFTDTEFKLPNTKSIDVPKFGG